LWQALCGMFELDRSAARGLMTTRELVIFEHQSPLGNAQAHRLFERVTATRKDPTRPARAYADYQVSVEESGLPAGVSIHRPCRG
ncbi:MAG: type I CRISPR-associated protein Cas7, partial [Phycisphaerae bacterium]|nr:type I CRISPR-associated protein Cas7 [Phycisphaerae bacterium]